MYVTFTFKLYRIVLITSSSEWRMSHLSWSHLSEERILCVDNIRTQLLRVQTWLYIATSALHLGDTSLFSNLQLVLVVSPFVEWKYMPDVLIILVGYKQSRTGFPDHEWLTVELIAE